MVVTVIIGAVTERVVIIFLMLSIGQYQEGFLQAKMRHAPTKSLRLIQIVHLISLSCSIQQVRKPAQLALQQWGLYTTSNFQVGRMVI